MVALAPRSAILTLSFVIGFFIQGAFQAAHAEPSNAETVLTNYIRAVYSRDAATAYDLLSAADQEIKTLEEYANETSSFKGAALSLSKALADSIQFNNITVHIVDGLGHVAFDAVLPNANDPALRELMHGFAPERLEALSSAEMNALKQDILERSVAGQLPLLKSEGERWSMVKEDGQWRVFENWAEAVEVSFEAETFHRLGWEFEPVRTRVMAKHGETIQMAYRAKNIGTSEVTGKARHIIGPDEGAGYLNIIACFCFLEETLAPGEEVELPLIFRVDFDAPEDLKKMTVKYEFYPADQFPGDDASALEVLG